LKTIRAKPNEYYLYLTDLFRYLRFIAVFIKIPPPNAIPPRLSPKDR
jgi:hypothetical protein